MIFISLRTCFRCNLFELSLDFYDLSFSIEILGFKFQWAILGFDIEWIADGENRDPRSKHFLFRHPKLKELFVIEEFRFRISVAMYWQIFSFDYDEDGFSAEIIGLEIASSEQASRF